jgi:hypothetical protein
MAFFMHFMNALVAGIVLMRAIKMQNMHELMRELKVLLGTPGGPGTWSAGGLGPLKAQGHRGPGDPWGHGNSWGPRNP